MNRRDDRLEHLREQRRALESFLANPELLKADTVDDFKKRLGVIEEDIRKTESF